MKRKKITIKYKVGDRLLRNGDEYYSENANFFISEIQKPCGYKDWDKIAPHVLRGIKQTLYKVKQSHTSHETFLINNNSYTLNRQQLETYFKLYLPLAEELKRIKDAI